MVLAFMVALALYATMGASYLIVYYQDALKQYGGAAKYPAEAAIKILFFGVLIGSAGYFGGTSMSLGMNTIYNMLGLNGATSLKYDDYYTIISDEPILANAQWYTQFLAPVGYFIVSAAVPAFAFMMLYLEEEKKGLVL